jgi:hypothetical protein
VGKQSCLCETRVFICFVSLCVCVWYRVGTYGLRQCSRFRLGAHHRTLCVMMIMTGIMSAFFHATLWWIGQVGILLCV